MTWISVVMRASMRNCVCVCVVTLAFLSLMTDRLILRLTALGVDIICILSAHWTRSRVNCGLFSLWHFFLFVFRQMMMAMWMAYKFVPLCTEDWMHTHTHTRTQNKTKTKWLRKNFQIKESVGFGASFSLLTAMDGITNSINISAIFHDPFRIGVALLSSIHSVIALNIFAWFCSALSGDFIA